MSDGALIQVDPAGPTLNFQYNPETVRYGGRKARLSDIDRPHRLTAVEWEGRGARTIQFTLRLDGFPDTSVNAPLLLLESMAGVTRPNDPPPKVRFRYGGGVTSQRYVIEDASRGREIRRADLQVVRIDVDVTLREWVEPALTTSPAKRVQQKQSNTDSGGSKSSGKTHVVKKGDTLWAISDRYLGSGTRWKEIQKLNGGPRDPRLLQIGTRLRIPAR